MNAKTKKILLWVVIAVIVIAACWWILSDGSAFPADDEIRAEETSELSDGGETDAPPEETAGPSETLEDGDATPEDDGTETEDLEDDADADTIDEDGHYTSRDDVAAYLHLYGHLPENFLTKDEARDLGWDSSLGNLDEVAPGMSIGGDRFGNREGLLPTAPGRQYYECDIDYEGGFRNGKRIVWSNDGLIYYTEDHYESFVLLYGGEQ